MVLCLWRFWLSNRRRFCLLSRSRADLCFSILTLLISSISRHTGIELISIFLHDFHNRSRRRALALGRLCRRHSRSRDTFLFFGLHCACHLGLLNDKDTTNTVQPIGFRSIYVDKVGNKFLPLRYLNVALWEKK